MTKPTRPRRITGSAVLLVAAMLVALILPTAPAAAQGTTPDNWRKGAAAVSDNFSKNTGQWTVDTGSGAVRTIARGRLSVKIPETELFRWATLDAGQSFADFYAEVDAAHVAGPLDGMMGIVFRYVDVDNFYAFVVSTDGWYALLKYADGEASRPVEWAESDVLVTGEGAQNTLAVLANGSEIALYANDEELDRVRDGDLTDGTIALLGGTNKDGGLEVGFDNFAVWNKPGASGQPSVGRKTINRTTPTPAPAPASGADAVVSSDTLNVRGGPGTNYPVLGALKKGDGVKVIGRSADSQWAKLGFTDVSEAWAAAQYLTFRLNFASVPVVKAPAAPAQSKPPAPPPQPPANKNVAYLLIENHIGADITVQVNDKNYWIKAKKGDVPGRLRVELQGLGRYRIAAQLPNGGSDNWDLYVEPTANKCTGRQGCIWLGATLTVPYS